MASFQPKHHRHLPAFLLLFLTDGPTHGGVLWTRLQDDTPTPSLPDSGAVYRVLRELEKRGCVQSFWDTLEPGPAKRVYQLTETGMEELQMWHQDILARKRNLDYFLETYQSKFAKADDESNLPGEGRDQS